MTLMCPKCKQPIDISGLSQPTFQCASCGETIDIGQLRESTCPICCGEFGSDDTLVQCPDCKTVYHSECWDENHGCSTYGCASTKHLETHNASDSASGDGLISCPFCGSPHASTDLVCPSCGHVLQAGANNDDMLDTVQKAASDVQRVAVDCMPKLKRNFQLLFSDVKDVVALAWKTFSKYADFKGTIPRNEYLSYIGVLYALATLLSLMKAELVVYWIVYPACIVPTIACTVRRLRDTGLSPWMIFAIPILPLLVLVPTVTESSHSEVLS